MRLSLLFLLGVLVFLSVFSVAPVEGRIREGECEVCLKRVAEFITELKGETKEEKIESGIRRICKGYTDKADKRFCYYIGGSDDAATSLLRTISVPLKNHLPADLICEKLKKADDHICQVKYEKPKEPVDYSKVDFNKMRVKELKGVLTEWGEKCDGCTEKGDFLRLIKQVFSKHVPNAVPKDL